ncbi:MAG: aminoacyl-tRNA hydrolase [Acidobacteria bacterium]|nr:MAG: aminoacyl-tRNA hydrolase [Acidobacteriota bacterium]
MWIVLGLGNPGPEYERTRHNAGFRVVERLAARHGIALDRVRHRARLGQGNVAGTPALLAQPLTFMNLAGEAARPLLAYHGADPGRLLVIHDEADLPPGTVRVKMGGGIAGHNGLRSIVRHLGTRDFARIRVGIGRPASDRLPLERYVLSAPSGEEREAFEVGIELAADAAEAVLADGVDAAMQRFNRRRAGDG